MIVRSAIQCVWDPGPRIETPSIYTLHWKSADGSEQEVRGNNSSAYIPRDQVSSHSKLSVWVRVENPPCSASSGRYSFNTASIVKPATPTIENHTLRPLEIYWEPKCSKQGLSEGNCHVRHRVAPDEGWQEEEEGLHGRAYSLENVHPYSWYEFQVRCACLGSLLSDWSQVYKVESPGAAPVGLLDVWSDCRTSFKSSECVLMWKRPPRWQARGEILGYVVMLFHNNGTVTVVNASVVAMPTDRLTCDKKRCHLDNIRRDVTAVNVSAYTAHGATTPARLYMPLSAQENRGEALKLDINSKALVVFWKLPTQHINNNQSEYVVQYKQAGHPPTQGFDWIRVDRSKMSATLTGQFEKYIAYQVALFSVSPNGSSDHISSAVGYAHEGTPLRGPFFDVVSTANSANVTWEPIPLLQRRGVIVCYQIGVDSQRVYNVSVPQGIENQSLLLERLKHGQEYMVWIRAMTAAGPGPNSTMLIKTQDLEHSLCYANILIYVSLFRTFKRIFGLIKVPDPNNSHVVQKGSWVHICVPAEESDPVLSQLEIVKSCLDEMAEEYRESQGAMKGVADQGKRAGSGIRSTREECYSKMTDSDEDMDTFTSDYEKHFIPTAEDIMRL
ncbi:Interleukin-12 receptor subunit beta-2 [Merluccius polli]|uniref:Interleukin-12 receptor subunit beta-2 n=1 Tax=Merluccius polli TaxID=89951 RepID=A0AA47MPL4_MERPO|nr:Interleukin-12 receptor subunit beta-2 [Merluccius polli]